MLLGIFVATTWSGAFASSGSGELTVSFLNVGQGDAIFIEAPSGAQMLIDGGPNKAVLRELSEQMSFFDKSIDVVLATHPDQDHIGGLPEVLERFEVGTIVVSGNNSNTETNLEFLSRSEDEGAEYIVARRGMKIFLDEQTYFEVLFPDRDASGLESNTASVFGRLVYGEISFILTGDSPKGIEEYVVFLENGEINADVLKLGHHGSKTSTSSIFLGAVSPEYVVVSAEKDSRYGHPHEEVISKINQIGSQILSTAELGTITFKSDGVRVWVE